MRINSSSIPLAVPAGIAAFAILVLAGGAAAQQGSASLPSQAPPSSAQPQIQVLPSQSGQVFGSGVQATPAQPQPVVSQGALSSNSWAIGQPVVVQPLAPALPPTAFGNYCIIGGLAFGPGPVQPKGIQCVVVTPNGPVYGFVN